MFAKQQRYSFKRKLPQRSLHTGYFTLRYQSNQEGVFRCGVVVGKKIDKRSTVRNRLKRRFIHALRDNIQRKTLPYTLVFFLKKELVGKDFVEMKRIIYDGLTKAHILHI